MSRDTGLLYTGEHRAKILYIQENREQRYFIRDQQEKLFYIPESREPRYFIYRRTESKCIL
jgi:hypothetical protein